MSSVLKCQALHIVRSCLWYFYLNKVNVVYINICGFISRDEFLYESTWQ